MADWSKPVLTSTYTNFLTEVKDRDVEAATWFDGTSPTNTPTNAKRFNTSSHKFEKWNGSAWVDMDTTFTFPAISVSGALSVTGNTALSTMTASGNVTLNGGTANGIAYLNGSKVVTTGSALQFDGANMAMSRAPSAWAGDVAFQVQTASMSGTGASGAWGVNFYWSGSAYTRILGGYATSYLQDVSAGTHKWRVAGYSATAGSTFSFTDVMTLDASGRLLLGATSGTSGQLIVANNGAANNAVSFVDVNGAGRTFVTGPGTGTGTVGDFGFYDLTASQQASLYTGGASGKWAWYTNGTERARIDSSGNLGLGVTPSAWGSFVPKAIQLPKGVALASQSNANAGHLVTNAFYDGAWKYVETAAASSFVVNNTGSSGFAWFTAPSGTAGNAISFTQAMTLDASGNLGVGTSSPGARLEVVGTGNTIAGTASFISRCVQDKTTYRGVGFGYDSSGQVGVISAESAGAGSNLAFWTYSGSSWGERARIDSSGQFHTKDTAGGVKPAYDCRAYVNFNGTGTVAIRGQGNVSSITDNGTGDYTVNFTTALSDINFATVVEAEVTNGDASLHNSAQTTSTVRVVSHGYNNTTLYDATYMHVAVFR